MFVSMRLLIASVFALPFLSAPSFAAQNCEESLVTVYFATDRSELTQVGMDVVEAAVDRLDEACTLSRVNVGGHTDTSEGVDETWSAELSMARAEHVTDLLVEHGIARTLVWTGGGKDDYPAYATSPDVKEPLIRRAEIRFLYD